jgi:hypothetical protein
LTNVHGKFETVGEVESLKFRRIDDETLDTERWSLRSFSFRNEWNKKEAAWGEGKWSVGETFPVVFHEPFQVASHGEDYYFLTASGKVYRSPKPEKGKERKTEAVWEDAKRPVVAIMQDADAKKSYLFCKPDKDGTGVYFELSAKPAECPYDAKRIKPGKPDDPLPAVLGYAKILLADKKIKEK